MFQPEKQIRFGGKSGEAFAIFFQLWQFVKQSVWSGVVQAPGEILEIAQGWSRQREICMSQQIHHVNNLQCYKSCFLKTDFDQDYQYLENMCGHVLDVNKCLDVLAEWIYFVVSGYSRPLCQLHETGCQSRLSIFGQVCRITGIHGASWEFHLLPETKIILSRTNTFLISRNTFHDLENKIDN